MKPIDATINAHLNDGRYVVFQLIQITTAAATYRYTDAPLTIIWNGFTWAREWFVMSEVVIDADGELAASVTFEDASLTLRGVALGDDMQEAVIKVYEVWADATNSVFGQDLVIQGSADGCKCDGEDTQNPTATIAIRGVHASTAVAVGPTQDYTRNCRYQQFKGPQCLGSNPTLTRFGGATFCDRLYPTCVGFTNQMNFGGFRFALGPGNVVQWGTAAALTTAPRPQQPVVPPPDPPSGSTPSIPRTRAVRH